MNPEYVEPLRKEIESPAYQAWEETGSGLPLLDSFLKESARLNPLDNGTTLSDHKMCMFPANDGLWQ